jgi:hypothetical protein
MNYGELKTAVADDSHRSDLTSHIPRFIREAEGMIRRELRALPVSGTITESDRVSGGIYNLPTGVLEVRAIWESGQQGSSIQQVSLDAIRRMSTSSDTVHFAIRGDTIEFRGSPASNTEFDIDYLGHPVALASDSDTNTILTDHETLYRSAALFFLYTHTQDLELAQAALDTFGDVKEKLNESIGRKLGGASNAPAYNFGAGSGY